MPFILLPQKYPASGNACRASVLNGGHPGLRAGIIEAKDAVFSPHRKQSQK